MYNEQHEQGYSDGYADACIIALPVKTGEHTESRFCEIKAKYEGAIFCFNPSPYERGYAEGFDQKATEVAKGAA